KSTNKQQKKQIDYLTKKKFTQRLKHVGFLLKIIVMREKIDYLMPVLMVILIGLVSWMLYQNNKPVEPPKPIVITIPGSSGSTGTQIIENVKTIPIPIPGGTEVIVDEKWYKEYLEAKDSIERLNKYVQAIQIRT